MKKVIRGHSIEELTVKTPLKPVTSISAPTSFSENFSNKLLTNGILAIAWNFLFKAKLVNAKPSFRVAALKIPQNRFRI